MAVITLQRLVDGVFGGSYRALHEWQAEIAARHGVDFWDLRRQSFERLGWRLELPCPPGQEKVIRGLLSVLDLMQMEDNQVIQPGQLRRIVSFLALEPERSAESEAVVAFLRREVVDQG